MLGDISPAPNSITESRITSASPAFVSSSTCGSIASARSEPSNGTRIFLYIITPYYHEKDKGFEDRHFHYPTFFVPPKQPLARKKRNKVQSLMKTWAPQQCYDCASLEKI